MAIKKSKNSLDLTRLDRIPPHNIEAEESILGAMMISQDAIAVAGEVLNEDDFYRNAHRKIYNSIKNLYVRGEAADPITVVEELKKMNILEEVGSRAYIHTLVSNVPLAANARHYSTIVAQNATLRRLIEAATKIATMGYEVPEDLEKTIDTAEQLIFSVSKRRLKGDFTILKDLLTEGFEQIEKLHEKGSQITGLPTGYTDFDRLTTGLQKSDLIIIAGRPSMGKTSFVLGTAQHIGLNFKKPVAIFSLEMARHQLSQRIMCSEARIDASRLRTGRLKEEDWPKLAKTVGELAESPIYIDDTASINVMELRAKARRLMTQKDLALIIVDYLQLMTGPLGLQNRQQEISEISRSLKFLGRELNVPIVAVSQLSRACELRQDKRPQLADLRESGAIEQDADLVAFIYRDELYYPDSEDAGIAEILIRKHRNGPTGVIRLAFLSQFTKFVDLAETA
ncbi:MAG: replicative DNA helicase [Actinomycetia bacterium]|nr:replicative DNA helicase [Actinomycetes bacterium]